MTTTTKTTTTGTTKNKNKEKDRCSVRNCKVKGALKVPCAASECTKSAHLICYTGAILSKYDLTPLPGDLVACCKKCHDNAARQLTGSQHGDMVLDEDNEFTSRRGNWDCDGLDGPNDPKTSMKILMDWMLEEGNYNKYCGKNNDGVKKAYWHTILAIKMTEGTKSKRDATSVKNKIKHLEESFKKAHRFATSETGAGLEEKHGKETFQDMMVRKICLYYYDMLDIMQDRAKVKPKLTSYELDEEGVLDVDKNDGDDDDDDDERELTKNQTTQTADTTR